MKTYKSRSLGLKWLSLLMVQVLVCLVWVQPGLAQDGAFTGVIVEDNAVVRAGGGNPFYAVARLPKGSQVTVEEVVFGWYRIAPPAGSASVIEKSQVQLSADGKSATVNVDNAPVFAASIETDNASPNKHWRRQLNLERGKTVQVLGDEGRFYRITPPAGASVYVAPTALRRADASAPALATPVAPVVAVTPPAPAVTTAAPAAPTTTLVAPAPMITPPPAVPQPSPQPSSTATPAAPAVTVTTPTPAPAVTATTPATTTVTVTPAAPTTTPVVATPATPVVETPALTVTPTVPLIETPAVTPAPAPSPVTITPAPVPAPVVRRSAAAFAELEQRFREAMAQPLENQPHDELIVAYRALQSDTTLLPAETRSIVVRLMQLDRNQKLATQLKDLSSLRSELDQRQESIVSVRIESERRANAPQTGVPGEGKYYDAVGQLVGSAVYDGQRMPMLYRLLDASSRRTVAYVQPSDKLDPKVYLGQVVGLIGTSRYDPALKLNIFEVKSADILQANPHF